MIINGEKQEKECPAREQHTIGEKVCPNDRE